MKRDFSVAIGIIMLLLVIISVGMHHITKNLKDVDQKENSLVTHTYTSAPKIEQVEDINSSIYYISVVDEEGNREIIYQYKLQK